MGKKKIKIKKVKRVNFSNKYREIIAKECGYKCQLCPRDLKNDILSRRIDHKIPLSKGGTNDRVNLWLLCAECDSKKKNEIIPEASSSAVKSAMEKTLSRYPYLRTKLGPRP